MSNDLKDIANRLCPYDQGGWQVLSAEKLANGNWKLEIQPMSRKEATDDEN